MQTKRQDNNIDKNFRLEQSLIFDTTQVLTLTRMLLAYFDGWYFECGAPSVAGALKNRYNSSSFKISIKNQNILKHYVT